ncbi:CG2941, partial [Drosophila busckii]
FFFIGNEREIRSLSQLVLNVLVEHELVQSLGEPEIDPGHKLLAEPKDDADAEQLRGAFMYLVLNTAHAGGGEQAEVLRLNPHCVHLLQQLPTQLPQLVTVSLALMCGLQPQLLEFLGCAPRWLSTQYHDSLNETLSHLIIDKQKQLPLICGVLNAVTQAICLEDHDAFIGYAVRLLQRHLLDSEERLSLLRTNARQRYLGAAMHQLLDVMLFNMEALAKPPTAPDYALVYTLRSAAVSIKQEPDVPGKLRNYANKLMDAVQRVLQQVSITTFMYWQELPSSRLLYKLQGDICLQAQQLLQLLAQDEILGKHKLCLQIQNFADAAQTFEERLEDLPLGELLELLDGDLGEASQSQLLAGLDQLLSRAIAMGSEECVETMAKHVHLLGYKHALMICEHLAQIVKFKQEQEEVEEENDFDEMYGDLLCDVLTPTFANCTIADQLKLLHKRDDLQLLKCFNFYMPDSNERRLEFFNNLRSDIKRLKLAQYLQFCWEMPVQTWRHLACLAASCPDYARLYWHLVTYCAPHAAKNVEATLVQILLNDRPHYNLEFPISLYETPVLLGGMQHYHVLRHQQRRRKRYRQRVLGLNLKLKAYTPAELQSMQNMYLDMCAAALEQFTTNEQWSALMRMLQLLQRLEAAEKRLFASSQRHWQHQRQQLRRLMQNKAPMEAEENARRHLKLANRYCSMHHRMGNWRQNHGTLFGQLIKSSDELRAARLQDFDVERLQL